MSALNGQITPEARAIISRHPDWYYLGETETHVDMSEWPGGGYHFIRKPTESEEAADGDYSPVY